MRGARSQLSETEAETVELLPRSLRQLVVLDVLRDRLHSAHRAIADADTWSSLAHAVQEAFAAQNADLVAQNLIGTIMIDSVSFFKASFNASNLFI